MKSTHFPAGNYRFLAAPGRPFSSGIVADEGYDLVRVTFLDPIPLEEGVEAARRHVEGAGRPATAIGAFELRIPEQFTREQFDAFNDAWVARLATMGLTAEPDLPTARTNVAPTNGTIEVPSVYAFTYTISRDAQGLRGHANPSFRMSGSAETRKDGSPDDRLRSIIETLSSRMAALDVSWEQSTAINLYGATQAPAAAEADLIRSLARAMLRGVTWIAALPPVQGVIFEMDSRRVGTELIL